MVVVSVAIAMVVLVFDLVGAVSAPGTTKQAKHECNRYVKGELGWDVYEETGRDQVARRLETHCIWGHDLTPDVRRGAGGNKILADRLATASSLSSCSEPLVCRARTHLQLHH